MDHADSFRHGHHVAPSHAVLIEQLLVFGGPRFPFEGEQRRRLWGRTMMQGYLQGARASTVPAMDCCICIIALLLELIYNISSCLSTICLTA